MKPKVMETATGAVAVEAISGDGKKIVGIGNLRVLLVPDGKFWYAQGLEIDYGVQGNSVDEAKKNFEEGLLKTIELHVRIHGNIDNMLSFAPSEVLREAAKKRESIHLYLHVSTHDIGKQAESLPFAGIDYFKLAEAA